MKDKEKKNNDKNDAAENKEEMKSKAEKQEEQQGEANKDAELKNKVETLELELTVFKDKFLRKAAEFENYKRRTENDQLNLLKYGAEGFIRRILPIVDDFERSLAHMEETAEVGPIKDGVKLIYDKFVKILNDQGVKKIEAVGKPFDVHYHEALMARKDENAPPHTVLNELETGYIYNDKVIRHSKVIVSEDSAPENIPGTEGENNNLEENG